MTTNYSYPGIELVHPYHEALQAIRKRREMTTTNIWRAINREADWQPPTIPDAAENRAQGDCDRLIFNAEGSHRGFLEVGYLMFEYEILAGALSEVR